jgi:hypothetical protein
LATVKYIGAGDSRDSSVTAAESGVFSPFELQVTLMYSADASYGGDDDGKALQGSCRARRALLYSPPPLLCAVSIAGLSTRGRRHHPEMESSTKSIILEASAQAEEASDAMLCLARRAEQLCSPRYYLALHYFPEVSLKLTKISFSCILPIENVQKD